MTTPALSPITMRCCAWSLPPGHQYSPAHWSKSSKLPGPPSTGPGLLQWSPAALPLVETLRAPLGSRTPAGYDRRLVGWLVAEPSIAAKVLMDRLVAMIPEIYGSKTQLRTLQRRVKTWRSAHVTAMVLGGLRKPAEAPVDG